MRESRIEEAVLNNYTESAIDDPHAVLVQSYGAAGPAEEIQLKFMYRLHQAIPTLTLQHHAFRQQCLASCGVAFPLESTR